MLHTIVSCASCTQVSAGLYPIQAVRAMRATTREAEKALIALGSRVFPPLILPTTTEEKNKDSDPAEEKEKIGTYKYIYIYERICLV